MQNDDSGNDKDELVRPSGGSSLNLSTILTVVFVVLKLTGNINWHWGWVLSPLWITLVLYVFGSAVLLTLIAVHEYNKGRK